MCAYLKNDMLLPCAEFKEKLDELARQLMGHANWDLGGKRIREYTVAFAENQHGHRIAGKLYDEGDLFKAKKWDEDVLVLSRLCREVAFSNMLSKGNLSFSDVYFEKAVAYIDQVVEKGSRIDDFFQLLTLQGQCLVCQDKNMEAKVVYTSLYNLVAETYEIDHYYCLEAANFLINVLIDLQEYYDAEVGH